MSAATTQAPVTTAPTGTGTTIVPTLPTGHAVGDEIRIWVVNSGITTWSAPAGWTIKRQQASSGNASTGVIGTLLYHKVVSGDTLPLASPTCTLGATVTRSAVAFIVRGADLEGVHTLPEWLAFASNAGTANPVRPTTVTTLAPEMLVHIFYGSRSATTAPEQTNYTQVQQVINSGIIVNNVSERTIADQNTALSNQDASPTSGARWIAIIACTPSPDYPYYRSGSQAFNANGTNVTPALPAGTTASDNRENKDLVVLTAQCAGVAPTVNTPAHWTLIAEWSNTTSGGVTTVRKWRAVYTGTLDRQVNRTPSGEIFAYLSVYHNAHQTIPIGTSAVQQNASSTTSTFPALPRTGTKATVQATCVADGTPTFTAPSGWTERNDSQGVTCADQSFNATGTTASASFTLSSASPTLAGLMEVFSVASVINLILTPATATLALTTFAPTVVVGADETVTPNTTSLTLTTFAPTIFVGLPFPQTGELDNFNRANGALGANWGGNLFAGDNDLIISGNQVKGTADLANNGWATPVGPDCEVWTEIVTYTDHTNVVARWSALDSSTPDGYMVAAQADVGLLKLYRFDNGSFTQLTTFPQVVASGDALGMRIVDDVIYVFYKDVSVANEWKFVGQFVDATYSAAGIIGLYHKSSSTFTDNFGGGTLGAITVTPASAALTLTTFAPKLATTLTAQTATLTLTTFAPAVSVRINVTPATATLTLTGFAPSLRLSVTPATATLTTTTFSPQLRTAITPVSTSLVVTTFAPSVTLTVTVPPTSLTLTTFAPTVSVTTNITVTPAAANLSLSTFAATLREVITPASQSLTLTSFTPQLREVTTVASASLTLTTFAPLVVTNTIVTPAIVSLTLSTFAPVLIERVMPSVASLTLSTFAPDVIAEADVTVVPATAMLALTGFTPQLREQAVPSTASLAITTFAPEITVSADITASPTPATLTLTTFIPSLQLVVTPAASALSLSAFAPTITISADRIAQPTPASLTLETFAPQLRLQLTPATAQLSVSASAPVLQLSLQPATATLSLVAFAPTITTGAVTGTIIAPATQLLTLTTYAPAVRQWRTPPRRTYVVESSRRTVVVQRDARVYLIDEDERELVV